MDNEQELQELWWASLSVKDTDRDKSIKTALLDFVEKREDQFSPDRLSINTCYKDAKKAQHLGARYGMPSGKWHPRARTSQRIIEKK